MLRRCTSWLGFVALLLAMGPASGQAQQAGDALAVQPARLAFEVARGQTATATVVLANHTDAPVPFAFARFAGGAPPPSAPAYAWIDSTEPGGPAFDWFDVADVGQVYVPGGGAPPVELPFAFPFFETTQTFVVPGPRGYLSFGADADVAANDALPDESGPNGLVAPFWDDLRPGPAGTIHTYHDRPGNRFIVQYTAWEHAALPGSRFTFQVMLYPSGNVLFQYLEATPGATPSIGLEDDLGRAGLAVGTAAEPGRAVLIDAVAGFARPAPASGVLPPKGTATVTLTVRPDGLPPGVHTDVLAVTFDHPTLRRLPILMTLATEGPAAPPFVVSPSRLDVTLERGETTERTLSLENIDPAVPQTFRLAVRQTALPAALPAAALPPVQREAAHRLGRHVALPAYASDVLAYTLGRSRSGRLVHLDLDDPNAPDVLAPIPLSVAADFALGDPGRLFLIASETQVFQILDPATGQRHSVGVARPRSAIETWTDLTTDPTDGTLYGATVDGRGSLLYRLDPATGEAFLVGEIGTQRFVMALAVDTEGQLYGLDIRGEELLRIEKRSGAAVAIGPLGYTANEFQSMDFDPATQTLFLAAYNGVRSELRTVDRATGETTLVAPFEGVRLGFLALPEARFVAPAASLGTLEPGARQALAVRFDATHLVAGTYSADLQVRAEGAPPLTVPVTLHVRGQGQIELRRSRLDFGQVFVGGERGLPLTIRNVGTDTLHVRGVSADVPAFGLSDGAAGRLPLALPPGALEVLDVFFRPGREATFTGTLRIDSSDPSGASAVVSLQGRGRAAPQFTVQPAALAVDLVQGRQAARALRLENSGSHTLRFRLALADGAFDDAAAPPVLMEDFAEGLPAAWPVIDNAGAGLTWQAHTAFPAGLLYDNWTGGRGPAAMISSHAAPQTAVDAELRTPPLVAPASNLILRFRLLYIDQGEGGDVLDVEIRRAGSPGWTRLERFDRNVTANEMIGPFMGPGRLLSYDLAPYLGAGDAFEIRWRYQHAARRPEAWYVQLDDVSVAGAPTVLTPAAASILVPPGTVEEVPLTFDAEGLVPGRFETTLYVHVEDPAVSSQDGPDVAIPLRLEVFDGVRVALPTRALYPNQTAEVPLYLEGGLSFEAFAFGLTYDPDHVEVLGLALDSTLAEGARLAVDAATPGLLTVRTVGALPAPVVLTRHDAPVLLRLRLRTRDRLGESPLDLVDFSFDGAVAPSVVVPGRLVVTPLYGDVSLDLVIDQGDVHRLALHVLGIESLRRAARQAADVSGDGHVTFHDAALLRRYLDGTLGCFPADPACDAAAKQARPASARLRWGQPAPAAAGTSVQLPIVVEQIDGDVTALSLTAELEAGTSVEDVVAGALPEGWTLHWHVEGRTLRVGAFGTAPLAPGQPFRLALDRAALPRAEAALGEAPPHPLAPAVDVPEQFTLGANYPNPFNPATTIPYTLAEEADVSLVIFNLLGQPVRTLVATRQPAGRYAARWDGRTDAGALAASGSYIYQLRAAGFVATRRLLLVK